MSDGHSHATTTIRRVLLVDDHEILLKSLARDFDREGLEVLKATNIADALALAAEHQPDLAIVDLFLAVPENGIELIKALKAQPQPPVCILISAHMSVAHAVLGVRAGADDVFLKPVTAQQALQRVAGHSGDRRVPERSTPTLNQIEWEHISRVLEDYDGNITHAAEALGVFRQSLQRKIQRHAPRVLATGTAPTLRRAPRKRKSTATPDE